MDIGQGYQTVMAQIAGEILSVPPAKIRVETPDTDCIVTGKQIGRAHV